jgi:hypothetical protein
VIVVTFPEAPLTCVTSSFVIWKLVWTPSGRVTRETRRPVHRNEVVSDTAATSSDVSLLSLSNQSVVVSASGFVKVVR